MTNAELISRGLLCLVAPLVLLLCILNSAVAAETLDGTAIVSVVDLRDGAYETRYALQDSTGSRVALDVLQLASKEIEILETGAQVALSGSSDGVYFIVSSVQLLKPVPLLAQSDIIGGSAVTGTRKLAVIIVSFSDGGTVSCSAASLDTLLYTGTPSMQGLYEATSKNQLTWQRDANGDSAVDIFGPYTINVGAGTCDTAIEGWGEAAKVAATNNGVNLSAYTQVATVVPDTKGCQFGGVADLACGDNCQTVIVECDSMNNWIHELGHNLGMRHSSTDTNNDLTVENEGGDFSCPMGDGDQTVYFNAPQQDLMGWFDASSSSVQTISNTGTYTLSPLSTDPNTTLNPQILKIKIASDDYYYLSYRQTAGTYNQPPSTFTNKLQIHRFKKSERSSGSDNSLFIKGLNDGESFQDSGLGFTVAQDSHDASSVTVLITIDGSTPVANCSSSLAGSQTKYALWNSFLGVTNILELINPDGNFDNLGTTQALVSLYTIEGVCQSQTSATIAEGGQTDIILNDMAGFPSESYGIVRIDYTGNISGRLSYYKARGEEYDFAYSVDLREPLTGNSTFPYNTFSPGPNVTSVFNWLTIVNLDSNAKSFSIESTNAYTGEVRLTRSLTNLGSFRRSDMDGGHGVFGGDTVGSHRVIPADSSASYIALLTRYGATATEGQYAFAFPITAGSLSGSGGVVPISSQFGETNWVEFNATGSFTAYGADGSVIGQAAGNSGHVSASSLLESGTRGVLVSDSASILSMFYLTDLAGNITGVYGMPGRFTATGSTFNGSYNLYLGMQNWLTISNPTNSSVSTSIYRIGGGTSGSKAITLSPFSTSTIPIHTDTELGASANSYGLIRVQPSSSSALTVDLIRYRPYNDVADFAFPTEVLRAE